MNHKLLITAALLTLNTSIYAAPIHMQQYFLGGSLEYLLVSQKVSTDYLTNVPYSYTIPAASTSGVTIYGGYRWGWRGIEFGYTRAINFSKTVNAYYIDSGLELGSGTLKQSSNNFFADGLFFANLSHDIEFKALVGAGILQTNSTSSIVGSATSINNNIKTLGLGVRLGAGLQYNLNKYFATDIMFKVQFPGNSQVSGLTSAGIGITYYI